jgi:hypothetical protein
VRVRRQHRYHFYRLRLRAHATPARRIVHGERAWSPHLAHLCIRSATVAPPCNNGLQCYNNVCVVGCTPGTYLSPIGSCAAATPSTPSVSCGIGYVCACVYVLASQSLACSDQCSACVAVCDCCVRKTAVRLSFRAHSIAIVCRTTRAVVVCTRVYKDGECARWRSCASTLRAMRSCVLAAPTPVPVTGPTPSVAGVTTKAPTPAPKTVVPVITAPSACMLCACVCS